MKKMLAVFLILLFGVGIVVADDDALPAVIGEMKEGNHLVVVPLAGWNRNTLDARDSHGRAYTKSDDAFMYGGHIHFINPNWVINDFIFISPNINDADVWGNLAFVNYYHDADAVVTPNIGAGYFYHEIKTSLQRIRIKSPIGKVGLLWRLPPGIALNPYLGYTEEDVTTKFSHSDDDFIIYGINARWQWRMLASSIKYFYQQNLDHSGGFQTFRAQVSAFASRHAGFTLRYDYMEHTGTRDSSFLAGPVIFF